MTLTHRGAFTGEPASSEDAQDEERHPVCEWVGDPVQRSHVRQGLEKVDGPDEAIGCAELESSKRPGPVRPSRTTRNSEAIRAYATTPWIVKARGIVPVSTNTLGESTACSPAGIISCPTILTSVVRAPIASSLRAVLVFSDMSGHRAQGVYLEHCDGLQVECLREQVHGDEPARRIPSLGESLHVARERGRVA